MSASVGKPAAITADTCGWYDEINKAMLVVEAVPQIGRVRIVSVPDGVKTISIISPLFSPATLRVIAAKLTQIADTLELTQ